MTFLHPGQELLDSESEKYSSFISVKCEEGVQKYTVPQIKYVKVGLWQLPANSNKK